MTRSWCRRVVAVDDVLAVVEMPFFFGLGILSVLDTDFFLAVVVRIHLHNHRVEPGARHVDLSQFPTKSSLKGGRGWT